MPEQSWPFSERRPVRWHEKVDWGAAIFYLAVVLFWVAVIFIVLRPHAAVPDTLQTREQNRKRPLAQVASYD